MFLLDQEQCTPGHYLAADQPLPVRLPSKVKSVAFSVSWVRSNTVTVELDQQTAPVNFMSGQRRSRFGEPASNIRSNVQEQSSKESVIPSVAETQRVAREGDKNGFTVRHGL